MSAVGYEASECSEERIKICLGVALIRAWVVFIKMPISLFGFGLPVNGGIL